MADLPILNWTAARASDVAAQILLEWRELAKSAKAKLNVYCNAQHLQIHEREIDRGLAIEWVGDERSYDGSVTTTQASIGATQVFDHVIMAVGYGLEKDNALSYWRNDTLGQPSLAEPHRTYLVSGQGDGAMIEVLRLRISQYRQDRILDELVVRRPGLHKAVKALRARFPKPQSGMFTAFEELDREADFQDTLGELKRRLRRDTEVILHLRRPTLIELFDNPEVKIAFQNRLLIYLLYKCGGFIPSCAEIVELARMHGIPDAQVIQRHGTEVCKNMASLLSDDLMRAVTDRFCEGTPVRQTEDIHWSGGYFGFPGPQKTAKDLDDQIRQYWRKEYLPGPTALAALSLCTGVAGLLRRDHPIDKRLRVTLHRTRMVGREPLLQQCCEYVGVSIPKTRPAAGRTFQVDKATIGLAYGCRETIRSVKGVSRLELRNAMEELNLNEGSREMSIDVCFILAMPVVQPEKAGKFSGPSPVAGVLYVDSEAPDWFIDNERAKDLSTIVERFVRDASEFGLVEFRRIQNRSSGTRPETVPPKHIIPTTGPVAVAFEIVSVAAPRATKPFQLNFDYVDFVPA